MSRKDKDSHSGRKDDSSDEDREFSVEEILSLCSKVTQRKYNQSMDVYDDKMFYGLRYKMGGKEVDLFLFSDKTVKTGESFDTRSSLMEWPNQLSARSIPDWVAGRRHVPDSMALFDEIRTLAKDYIEAQHEEHYGIIALYIFHTYLKYLFGVTPYLHINGQAESGKSTLMRFVLRLAFKGWFVTKPTAAPLFRCLEANMCSLGFDEFESYSNGEKSDVTDLLNDGYTRGGTIPRMKYNPITGEYKAEFFSAFSAKMFSSITDNRLASFNSRCIEIFILRTTRILKDIICMSETEEARFDRLRDDLYFWTLEHWQEVMAIYKSIEIDGLKARKLQIIKPLLVYAKMFGIYDDMIHFYKDTIEQKTSHEIDYDRDYLFLRSVYELVAYDHIEEVSIDEMTERYHGKLKECNKFIDSRMLPGYKAVGWKIRKFNVCSEIRRTSLGKTYHLSLALIMERIRRYGYESMFDFDADKAIDMPVKVEMESVVIEPGKGVRMDGTA